MKLNLIITLISFFFLIININFVHALTPDSIGVKTENGKQFIIHQVSPKEGWMSIARRYEVPMEQVIQANPGVEGLRIGQLVNVPVLNPKQIDKPEETQAALKDAPVQEIKLINPVEGEVDAMSPLNEKYKTPLKHTVKKGETLFSISKKFNVKMDDIRKWNGIESNNLQLGQDLIVGYVFRYHNSKNATAEAVEIGENELYASAGEVKKTRKELRKEKKEAKNNEEETESALDVPEINIAETKAPETKKETTIIEKATPVRGTVKANPEAGKKAVPITEKGSASWIDDNDINPSKFYALHRTAPIGTIIKVTNRMNSKTVFVKVVGVLPDTGDNSNITIKLSKAAASKLDVINARFQAELNYTLYE